MLCVPLKIKAATTHERSLGLKELILLHSVIYKGVDLSCKCNFFVQPKNHPN
jgi:hypothetical protein